MESGDEELHLVRVVSGLRALQRRSDVRVLVETRDSLQALKMGRSATEQTLNQLETCETRVAVLFEGGGAAAA